jgi:hypothetical protein
MTPSEATGLGIRVYQRGEAESQHDEPAPWNDVVAVTLTDYAGFRHVNDKAYRVHVLHGTVEAMPDAPVWDEWEGSPERYAVTLALSDDTRDGQVRAAYGIDPEYLTTFGPLTLWLPVEEIRSAVPA